MTLSTHAGTAWTCATPQPPRGARRHQREESPYFHPCSSKEAPERGITAFPSVQPPAAVQTASICLYQIQSGPISPLHLIPCALVPPACSSSVALYGFCAGDPKRAARCEGHVLSQTPAFFPLQALQHPINFSSRRLVLALRLNSPDLNFYPLHLVIPLSCNFVPPHHSLIR